MRNLVLLPLVAALMATPALASEKEGKKPETAQGQYVDLATVAMPIVFQGRLINYIFVSVRLNLRNNADAMAMRSKEPYFRDALVRAAHRTPFIRQDDFTRVDERMLSSTLIAEAGRIVGAGVVTSVAVTNQTAQKRVGLPKPPGKT